MAEHLIVNGWLCESSDRCTCGSGGTGYPGHEPGCGVTNLVEVDKLLNEHEAFSAAIERVEAVCVTGTRVATERMVSGSVVHVAAKDAIDTFAKAIRDALEPTP